MKNYVFLYYHNMRNQKDALKELGLDENRCVRKSNVREEYYFITGK